MKRLPLLALALCFSSVLFADEQIEKVQQALKDQGFYYGEVDGESGPETDAAIRRYQIRNGLNVSGKLDGQTLAALHLGPAAPGDSNTIEAVPPAGDAATPEPPPAVVQNDHDFLQRHAAATPAPVPDTEEQPQPREQPQPAIEPETQPPPAETADQAPPEEYARFLHRTVYENAPPEVQRSTVHRAQIKLAREGFFRGTADGQPSDDLSRAIAAYQRDLELPETGRLDMETLARLDLLPHRHEVFRDPSGYYGDYAPPPPPPRTVYRGIWVH